MYCTVTFYKTSIIREEQNTLKYLNNSTLTFIIYCLWKAHLFGLAAGRSQQERVQDIFPSQEEAVTVLIQEDGGKRELAMMTTEDRRPVSGQQICRERKEKDEQWHSKEEGEMEEKMR